MRSRAHSGWSLLACGLLVAALSLTGCGPKVVATVDGTKVLQSQVDQQINQMKTQHPQIFEGAQGQKLEAQFRQRIVDSLVTNILIENEAKREGVTVSSKEIDARLAAMIGNFHSKDQFDKALAQSGTTAIALRDQIQTQLITQRMVDKVTANVTVTAADAKDYYRINKETFTGPATVHMLAVKLAAGSPLPAGTLMNKIRAGASLASIARKYSIDKQLKASGGDLGTKKVTDLTPDLQGPAQSSPVGSLSGPIQTKDAVWIVKVLSRTPGAQKPYSQVKGQIYTNLKQEKQVKAFNDWVDALKKKAGVKTSS